MSRRLSGKSSLLNDWLMSLLFEENVQWQRVLAPVFIIMQMAKLTVKHNLSTHFNI